MNNIDPKIKKFCAWINNKEVLNDNEFSVYNPTNDDLLGRISSLSEEQVNYAYKCANNAFKKWKFSPIKLRIKILRTFMKNIIKFKEILAQTMMLEIAKNYNDCIKEIERSVIYIDQTISAFNSLFPQSFDGELENINKIGFFKRVPLGVILCISPFNYPINLSISKIIPALITGNTVVFKPASKGIISSLILSKLLIQSGCPAGVFNCITGKGKDISHSLITNKHIKLINYTGSTNIGDFIFKNVSTFTNFIFELGGNDPAIVLNDCDIDSTVEEIIKGSLSYNGQRCTAIKQVIVEEKIKNNLVQKLKEGVTKLSVGKPENNSFITSMIDKNKVKDLKKMVDMAIKNNANLIIGNKIEANIYYPTIIDNVTEDMEIFKNEQFGPIIPILVVKNNDFAEIIKIIEKNKYGLQISVFTENIKNFLYFANKLSAGRINFNKASQRGPDYFPFSGIKKSGLGSQGINDILKACTRKQGIIINY